MEYIIYHVFFLVSSVYGMRAQLISDEGLVWVR